MHGIVKFIILFITLPFKCINGDRHQTCKLIKIARLLECIDRALTEVPFYKNGNIVRVRKNNLSKIDENILVTYPNLALVDVRQNPKICGNINVEHGIVKRDCPTNTIFPIGRNAYLSPLSSTAQKTSVSPQHTKPTSSAVIPSPNTTISASHISTAFMAAQSPSIPKTSASTHRITPSPSVLTSHQSIPTPSYSPIPVHIHRQNIYRDPDHP